MNTPKPELLATFKNWVLNPNAVIIEVQSTGRDNSAEVIEVAVIDLSGTILLDTKVKPRQVIPAESVQYHGIPQHAVEGLPGWHTLGPTLLTLLAGRLVITYGLDFTRTRIQHSLRCAGASANLTGQVWTCMLKHYAQYWNAPGQYGDAAWQKQIDACHQQGAKIEDLQDNPAALSKATRTLRLLKALSAHFDAQKALEEAGEDSEPLPF